MAAIFFASGWRAALCLGVSVPATLALAFFIQDRLPGHGEGSPVGLMLLAGGLLLGSALWARWLARAIGWPRPWRLMAATALTFCLATFAAALALGRLEEALVGGGRADAVPIHVIFAVLFTGAAGAVTALVALVIGRVVGGWGPALRLAAWSGLAAGGAFLLADVAQDLLGRRVGGPRAEETLTMISVALIGNIVAAFASGGVMGWLLAARRQANPAKQLPHTVQELPTP